MPIQSHIYDNIISNTINSVNTLRQEQLDVCSASIEEIIVYLNNVDDDTYHSICKYLIDNNNLTSYEVSLMNNEQIAYYWRYTKNRIMSYLYINSLRLKYSEDGRPTDKFISFDLTPANNAEPTWIIDNILPENEHCICTGDSQIDRSLWAIYLGLYLSIGESPFTNINVSQSRTVVFVSTDVSRVTKNKIIGMLEGLGLQTQPDNFYIYNKDIDPYTGDGVKMFLSSIKDSNINPDVIIFDNFPKSTGLHIEPVQYNHDTTFENIVTIGKVLDAATITNICTDKMSNINMSIIDFKFKEIDKKKGIIDVSCRSIPFANHSYTYLKNNKGLCIREYYNKETEQRNNYKLSHIQQWQQENIILNSDKFTNSSGISAKMLFQNYKNWCKKNDITPFTPTKFGIEISHFADKKRTNKEILYNVMFSHNVELRNRHNIGIYKIVNLVNGKYYLGSSIDLAKRKQQHFRELQANKHSNQHLQYSFNKHGIDNFKFIVIEICTVEDVRLKEQQYLDAVDWQNVYNISKIVTHSSS